MTMISHPTLFKKSHGGSVTCSQFHKKKLPPIISPIWGTLRPNLLDYNFTRHKKINKNKNMFHSIYLKS